MVLGCCHSFPTFLHLRSSFIELDWMWPLTHGISSMQYGWWRITSCSKGWSLPYVLYLQLRTGQEILTVTFTVWLLDHTAKWLLTVWPYWKSADDCWLHAHFVLWPIMYGRKQSDPTSSLVYGVKMPSLSCYYGAYGSDHPLCSMLLTWMWCLPLP